LVLLWFCIATLCDWFKILKPLPQPIRNSEIKPKQFIARTCKFSRALNKLHVFASSFDWFTGLLLPL